MEQETKEIIKIVLISAIIGLCIGGIIGLQVGFKSGVTAGQKSIIEQEPQYEIEVDINELQGKNYQDSRAKELGYIEKTRKSM